MAEQDHSDQVDTEEIDCSVSVSSEGEINPTRLLKQELSRIKDEINAKYDTAQYSHELKLLEALTPFVKSEQQKTLQLLKEFYYYRGILVALEDSADQ